MDYFGFCKGIKNLNLPNLKELDVYEGFFAEFYNKCANEKFDIDLYLSLANVYGSKVLELACGSGRVLIPLLENGHEATGLDLSQDMLNILQRKCIDKFENVKLVCANMAEYISEEKYDMVILSQGSLCLLKDNEDRIKIFRNTYKNLRDGGLFVFNYIDSSFENITVGELKPKYFFSATQKSFIILTEKIWNDKSKSVINLYGEEITRTGEVYRYLGNTTKYLLSKSLIDIIISESGFTKIKDYTIEIPEGIMRFELLKK
ncbi:MAG TPA: class I SAM-dependent methyltransferase [Pseudobacteroides sp.]|uniref:class I SAM-dependent methyltransferase n=1 Tax=Pseudobacteroides sp. TaxID=1968840 RepID=UPI002F920BB3